MPMHFEQPARRYAPTAPPNLATWPFEPYEARRRREEFEGRPKATERLYTRDGRLAVAVGRPLPDGHEDLLTEAQVLGREPVEEPVKRRKVRRK
jgi:hypothetical protein